MKAKKVLVLAVCLMLVVSMMLSGCQKNEADVRIGTGGEGGNYYNYGLNLSEALSEEEEDYTMEVVSTHGSAANLRLLNDGYLEMALVQSDVFADALNGRGQFAEGKVEGLHAVTGLYTESCQFIVDSASGITDIHGLEGKKISIGEEDSGAAKNALEILQAYDIADKIEIVYESFADSAESLNAGEIDGFYLTASAPTTAIAGLCEEMDLTILSLDDAVVRRLLGAESAYIESVIPAGTYKNQTEDIKTIGVTAVLVASDAVPAEIEQAVLGILEDQGQELQEISFGIVETPVEEPSKKVISFDMYMTLALAVLVLYLGTLLRKKIRFLEAFCIPAPVIGGIIFSVLSCVLYVTGIVEFSFDETLKTVCMMIFFTSVGFQANLKVLKKGGFSLVLLLITVIILICCQNGLAIAVAKALNLDPLIGMCTGSIPMVGGHGTAGAFGIVLEDLGLTGATTLCTAAATFGLIMGSLMGGPIGKRLITKHDLMKTAVQNTDDSILVEDEKKHIRKVSMYAPAAYQIAIAMGIGTIVSMLLSKTGMTFPAYIGSMIVAAAIRNVGEYSGKYTVHMGEINDIGGICLSLFLGIAMVTLKLWQLAELALPLFILLAVQTVFMACYSYFVVFNVMGRNYDAAVLSAGTCGFGMGATPNAMANMQAVTEKFAPSVQAYLLVPLVGSMFADFINSLAITFFINLV